MPEFITSDQMRAVERAAIDSGQVTGLTLMERAGQGVVDALRMRWGARGLPQYAVVLCGPGNNGGDGFVIARLLYDLNVDVCVFFYGRPERLPPDARVNYDLWMERGLKSTRHMSFPDVTLQDAQAFSAAAYERTDPALVIDALFGIGLTRSIPGLGPLFERVRASFSTNRAKDQTPVHISVDIPSGLTAKGPIDEDPDQVFPCNLTVTFHRKKIAHQAGALYCGEIVVKDIGL